MYRVQKILSLLGVLSRRECEKNIKLGLVFVNNLPIDLGATVSVGDKISFDNQDYIITEDILNIDTKLLMYHKPIDEIVSRDDPQKRKSVFKNLPDVYGKWINVGRLDYKTSGLMLFTNNGDIANKLMHPSSNIKRTYEVVIKGNFDISKIKLSMVGIEIGNSEIGKFVNVINDKLSSNKFQVQLMSGKNREVRRIFEKLDCKVLSLKRISYGDISLGDLKYKSYRYIDIQKISKYI
ncbi:rRNA pseudouridine synthase [bacterium TMED221]|jgi:23S rRNA pseudouridine2605 synthase|nr:MAG: rRNA pseudouridine synthase [bacterium TMED221]|tara:strand:- start:474 stop:1184 length:711 start_codon:yes stop_codon:yes gene_type:complete